MQAPEWNTQDKTQSLTQWVEVLNEEARRQFLEAGTHVEIFFLFNDEGLMEVIPIAGMEKDEIVRELKKMLVERDGYAFIHISEGTMRHMDTADQVDMLLVHAEGRDGLSVAYCSTVAIRAKKSSCLMRSKSMARSSQVASPMSFRTLEASSVEWRARLRPSRAFFADRPEPRPPALFVKKSSVSRWMD